MNRLDDWGGVSCVGVVGMERDRGQRKVGGCFLGVVCTSYVSVYVL